MVRYRLRYIPKELVYPKCISKSLNCLGTTLFVIDLSRFFGGFVEIIQLIALTILVLIEFLFSLKTASKNGVLKVL